jgi:hypothetical protein
MRGGGLRRRDYHSTGRNFWRVLLDCAGEFEFCSQEGLVQGAPVCWGFWARGPGYPYGILELGSCPSWQGGNSVLCRVGLWLQAGQGNSRKVNKASGKRRVSIRPRYFKFHICFILL